MLSLFRRKKKSIDEKYEFPDPFISFLLKEDKNNNILLGKREDDDIIFIAVKNNKKLSEFMQDWFYQLKLYRNGHLSEEAYNAFLRTAAERYLNKTEKSTENTQI